MGRRKKITNSSIKVLSFDRQVEGAPINRDSSMGWVKWGLKNDIPEQLLRLYAESPTHHSAIDFAVNAVIGDGVDYDAMEADGSELKPNYYQSWDSLIRCVTLDYMLYGSFAIEIIKNKDNETYSFWHLPLHKIRWSEYDDDGQIPYYFICSDWTKASSEPPVKVKAFDMQNPTDIRKGEPYLYVYRHYNPITEYYSTPHYIAGLKAIQAECEFLNYDLKSSLNSFVPSGMLVLNEPETDDEKRLIINEVTKMFQGSENANSVMISFRNNIEESKPEFVPFSANNGNVNLFDASNTRTQARILSAHSIPDASLCGLPSLGATGFSSEADKLEMALKVYMKMTGNANRKIITDSINYMLSMNGVEQQIILKPFTYIDNDKVEETTDTNTDEITESQISEKVE